MLEMKITNVVGWEDAIRGMRNPMNSWSSSDTEIQPSQIGSPEIKLGEKDKLLMKKLINAGTDHRKFLRMINVYTDINAPLYWWKEMDTYKVGTVTNSCSTMHKIHEHKFSFRDFSTDKLMVDGITKIKYLMDALNDTRENYINTNDKKYWYQLIQLLPSSYMQKRTMMFNYETAMNMYNSRKEHKLDEWKVFCKGLIEHLPYFEEFVEK